MTAHLAGPARRRATRTGVGVRLLVAAVALAVVTGVVLDVAARPGSGGGTATAVQVRSAPPFALPAVTGGAARVTLGAGRPVLLSFFASWCTGCQAEMRSMAKVDAEAHGRVTVVGIDVNDTRSAAAALLRADHIAYPVGFDGQGTVADAYRLVGLPTTVFVDGAHRIVGQVVGPLLPSVAASWVTKLTAQTTGGNR